MKRFLIAIALTATTFLCAPAQAASLYLHTPSITGENPTPGYPGAMKLNSLTVAPDAFSIVKRVDSASPQLMAAVAGGTPLAAPRALLYNAAPSGPPDALLPFQNVIANAYTALGGVPATEQVDFSASTPTLIYLEIPGIIGASGTPGHPNIMLVRSFTLTGNEFSITKAVDSASPQIALAVASGTPFPTANLLFYNALVPASQPDETLAFHDVFATSHQVAVSGGSEEDVFSYQSITPEPSAGALALVGFGLQIGWSRRRRRILALPPFLCANIARHS